MVSLGVGVLCALGGSVALAQSTAATAPPVTPAVTVVAKREPVVTVIAPRIAASEAPVTRRQSTTPARGKAVDADGDGLADAQTARSKTAVPRSDSRTATSVKSATAPRECGEQKPGSASKSACGKANPLYADKAAQARNPVHEP